MPWETESEGKYQYYPKGDSSATPKDAPSAINVVVVPNVNLPKVYTSSRYLLEASFPSPPLFPVLGEKLTADYRYRTYMTSTTNGGRMATKSLGREKKNKKEKEKKKGGCATRSSFWRCWDIGVMASEVASAL